MFLRGGSISKFFWAFMALYMLNICVDSPDILTELPENLNYNDQESIIEIVVEQVLGFENAIPEQDDHDAEDHNISKNPKIIDQFLLDHFQYAVSGFQSTVLKRHTHYKSVLFHSEYSEIDAPPPKI